MIHPSSSFDYITWGLISDVWVRRLDKLGLDTLCPSVVFLFVSWRKVEHKWICPPGKCGKFYLNSVLIKVVGTHSLRRTSLNQFSKAIKLCKDEGPDPLLCKLQAPRGASWFSVLSCGNQPLLVLNGPLPFLPSDIRLSELAKYYLSLFGKLSLSLEWMISLFRSLEMVKGKQFWLRIAFKSNDLWLVQGNLFKWKVAIFISLSSALVWNFYFIKDYSTAGKDLVNLYEVKSGIIRYRVPRFTVAPLIVDKVDAVSFPTAKSFRPEESRIWHGNL